MILVTKDKQADMTVGYQRETQLVRSLGIKDKQADMIVGYQRETQLV